MRALGQIEWEVDLGRAVDAIRERQRATVRHVQMQQRPTVLGTISLTDIISFAGTCEP